MAQAGGTHKAAVVVDGGRAVNDLVLAVVIDIGHGKGVVALAIGIGAALGRTAVVSPAFA